MKKFIKDYLVFTKGERRAVLILLALILLVFVLPYWWPVSGPVVADKLAIEQVQRNTSQQMARTDSNRYTLYSSSNAYHNANRVKEPLFYFDPNTLPPEGWQRLGLRDKTIQTILHYRDKGGRFRQPEDIGKIYGLYTDEYTRLLPFVRIVPMPGIEKRRYDSANSFSRYTHTFYSDK